MSLRVRLLGTIVGAILLFFIISVVAARLTLHKDLMDLGSTEVTNGSNAFAGYWDSRKDQIRLLIAQDAVSDALRKNLQSHDTKALQDQLSNIARTSGLSFLSIVDNNGKVVARANGGSGGSLAQNKYVQRALTGGPARAPPSIRPGVWRGKGWWRRAKATWRGAGKGSGKV